MQILLPGKGRESRILNLMNINIQSELADLYEWTSFIVSNTDLWHISIEDLRTSAVVIVYNFSPNENKNSDQEEELDVKQLVNHENIAKGTTDPGVDYFDQ